MTIDIKKQPEAELCGLLDPAYRPGAAHPDTHVLPGHREQTTIERERRSNPFIRAWLDGEGLGEEPCRVGGEDATLLLWADDYDGGNKALVRLASGEETIVGGSRVERA